MAKAEIGWKGLSADGGKRDVYAHHVGDRWVFFDRERRFESWRPLPEPCLEDWMELLAAVERRVTRRLQRPEEPDRIRKAIKERFPDAPI